MGSDMIGPLEATVVTSLYSKKVEYGAMNASVNRMEDKPARCNQAIFLFLEGYQGLSHDGNPTWLYHRKVQQQMRLPTTVD